MRSPWNGGSISLRRRRCSVALLQQQRLRPEQRPQDDVAARGDRVDAVAGEEELDRLGVGEEDDVAGAEQPGAEGLAQAPAPVLVEGDRPRQEARRLQGARQRDVRRARARRRGARRGGTLGDRGLHQVDRANRSTAVSSSATFSSASAPPRSTASRTQWLVWSVEQLQRDALERLGDRGDLGQHVDAVGLVLDHPPQAADLALDPRQAPQDRLLVGDVAGGGRWHLRASMAPTIPGRGIAAPPETRAPSRPAGSLASRRDARRPRRPPPPLLGQGARDVRGRGRPADGRLRPDLGLRRGPADPDPRQGPGADADVGVLVRDDPPHLPQPLHLPGRPRRGRGPGAAGEAAADVPGRVRRPRLPLRLGLARVPRDGRRLRDRAARGPDRVGRRSPGRSSPRRPRPSSASTTRTSTSTAPPS